MNVTKQERTKFLNAALVAGTSVAWLLVLAASGPAEAVFPGANGRIAFQTFRDGASEIYAMDPDGTNPTRLTTNRAWEGEPAVSPDGERIAFVATQTGAPDEEELYVMDARDTDGDGNGDNRLRLTNDTTPDWSPSFSPDGTKIAYQEYGDGDSEVFVMNADGAGTSMRLTNNTLFDGNPRFSPDGKQVYFDTDRDGDPRNHTELYVMDAADTDADGDGDDQHELFGDPAVDYFASAISPDATRLGYQDYRDGDSEIYVRNLDGTGTGVRLTTNAAWDGLPAFSPDGDKLVFGTDRDLGLDKEELYTMDVVDADGDGNGDNQTRLTEDTTADYDPDWGPVPQPPAFLRKWGSLGTGNGRFRYPTDLAVDSSGYVYVVDKDNNRIQKFGPNGAFITKWGTLGNADGRLRYPRGVAVDPSGNVYVADTFNRRIQKFGPGGAFIRKWGTRGGADGQFRLPSDVDIDSSGNVYVTDAVAARVQKFSANGTFLTGWGRQGSGEGEFDFPSGIAIDPSGNVYVADEGNSRVQKFDPNGAFISKWDSAGTGDGQFVNPSGVDTDARGNVYVADAINNRVQKFGPDGTFISKWGVVGTGNGQFDGPTGVALDPAGNVYVVEQSNHRVQKFGERTPPTVVEVRPRGGSTGVAVRANAVAEFSEQMDRTTLTRATFKLYRVDTDGTLTRLTDVTVTPSLDGHGAVLNPFGASGTPLTRSTTYRAVLTTAVRDLAGNPTAADRAWTFKTES